VTDCLQSRERQRAIACKGRRHPWHSWHCWQCGFCNLQNLKKVAWYGHLKHRSSPLVAAIVVSWLIAFGEYCFQVPANRIGYGEFTGYQLKVIQEVITLVVFAVFANVYLGEPLRWNYAVAFGFILCAVAAAFWGRL